VTAETSAHESPQAELRRLVGLLSDYESRRVLDLLRDVASGERFWEGDIGLLYNDYVKARYFDLSRNLSSVVPAGPAHDEQPFVPIPLLKSYPDAPRVALPPPAESALPVTTALARRRSRRDYEQRPLAVSELSSLLHFAVGTTDFASGYGYSRWPLRTFPSSGGLQVPEIYVAVRDVTALDPGLYHYRHVEHELALLRPGAHNDLLAAIGIGQPYIASAPVVVLISGYYARASWKYGERAFRYMCMDVGFAAQNLYLVGEALDLAVCAIAGFIDDALERMLDVDPSSELPMLMVAVGPSAPSRSDRASGFTAPPAG